MSANLSLLVRRVPIPSRLGSTRFYHVTLRSGPNLYLTRPSIRWQPLLQRCYATQNNNSHDKGKNDNGKKDETPPPVNKKSNENVEKEQKKGPTEQSPFGNFFGEPQNDKPGNAEKQNADKAKDDPEEKNETVQQKIERLFRDSKKGQGPGPEWQSNQNQTNANNQQQQQNPNDKSGKPPPKKDYIEFDIHPAQLIFATILLYAVIRLFRGADSKEITWQEFRTAFLDKGLVDKLTVINDNRVKVILHSNATGQVFPEGTVPRSYYFTIGSVEAFERRLDEAQSELGIPSKDRIPVSYSQQISWTDFAVAVLPLVIIFGTIAWVSRRMMGPNMPGAGRGRGSLFDFASSKAKMFNVDQKINVTFKDVAGLDEAKEEIVEFVKFLKEPQIYERLGAKIPRGAILSGPPGTGKTLLAKATAGEAGVPFLSVSGSEFVEMFVGVGAARVRDLFAQARKHQPSIIFIDEIDAIGKSRDRGKFRVGNDEREQTLNQILVEMDGFGTTEHVVVLAGTNRVDTLDPALMRPGRFDRHIAIDGPDLSGRKQIFEVHLKKLRLADPIPDLAERLSILTAGFTGADIANACNEAALIAARYKADAVALKHFEQAIERVTAGLEKKSRVLSPEDKTQVAYHEAGHAVAGWNLEWVDPLLKVSIVPRARALGYASYLPKDEYMTSKRKVLDRMVMALAGRVSEEMFFGEDAVGSGASDDFRKVTNWATTYVTTWGMSKRVGPIYYASNPEEIQKPFSEETARIIDEEVKKIIMEAYQRTHELLTENREGVEKLAKQLMEFEVLTYRDVEKLLGPRKYPTKGVDLSKILGEESGFGRLVPRKEETEEPPIAATAPLPKPPQDGPRPSA